MDQVVNYRDPKVSKGQVERLARAYHRKYQATIGTSLMVEDLEQEFWLVWHAVCERFDSSKGFEFKAFLGVSIKNRAMELSKRQYRRNNLSAESLDRTVGDNEGSFIDMIADDAESVEDMVIRTQERDRVINAVDLRLRKIIELLEETPQNIMDELKGLEAKASYAASLGLSLRVPKEITVSMLSGLIGVSRDVRSKMVKEMQMVIHNG